MGDYLPRETTFHRRLSIMGDCLSWETTYHGRLPSIGDCLPWENTMDGRQPSTYSNVEEDIQCKTILDEKLL